MGSKQNPTEDSSPNSLVTSLAGTTITTRRLAKTTAATTKTTTSSSSETTETSAKSTSAASRSLLALGNDGEDLFLDWLDLLDDLSGWGDDFADLLDDGLGDGVLENVGLILRAGLLGGSLGAIVLLEHIQVGGGRSEEDVEWDLAGTDFDGGWGNGASGWHITELNLVSGLDGSVHDLASSARGSATAEASTHTAVSSRASATAISATVSSHTGNQSRDDHKLLPKSSESTL